MTESLEGAAKKGRGGRRPQTSSGGGSALVWMLVATILLGLAVLIFKSDYRFAENLETNRDFYPAVVVEE